MPPDHRYAQFCPVARTAEVLAQRWNPLIVRELLVGPQRFGDLKRRLRGVSTSVLSARLSALEAQHLVEQRSLAPPAASVVYELTETGRALAPVLREMLRFGVRLLSAPREGDHIEPDWFGLAIETLGKRSRSPARRYRLELTNGERSATLRVEGGDEGTRLVDADAGDVDLTIRAPIALMMGFSSGVVPPEAVRAHAEVELEGDLDALADFPSLFEMPRPGSAGGAT